MERSRRHEFGTALIGTVARKLEETKRKLERGELRGIRRRLAEDFVKRAERLLRASRFVQ